MKINPWSHRRLCEDGQLETILDLGEPALPAWPENPQEDLPRAPLVLCRCRSCGLIQMEHSIDRETLFGGEYWFRSGGNDTMKRHLGGIVDAIEREVKPTKGDTVIDIGCNDGTLLGAYQLNGVHGIGFEPSDLCPTDNPRCSFIKGFFSPSLIPPDTKAKVVTTIAMFYYLDDPVGFAKDIASILLPEGVWVLENNYAVDLIENTAFDQINAEHVIYWSIEALQRVCHQVGLELYRVQRNSMNGGSFHAWIGHQGVHEVDPSVDDAIATESRVLTPEGWAWFVARTHGLLYTLHHLLAQLMKLGKTVGIYGASLRGLTILAGSMPTTEVMTITEGPVKRLQLPRVTFSYAVERNSAKVDRFYGDTGIRIISEEQMRAEPPNYMLVLPYSFLNEFLEREDEFLRGGGKFIVPIPEVRIIAQEGRKS